MEPRRQSCRPWSLAATPGWDGQSCRGRGPSPPARAGLRVGTSSLRRSQPGLQDAGLCPRGCCSSFGDWRLASGPWKYFTVPAGHRISQTCVAQCTENLSLPRPARGWCCQLWCVHMSVCVWLCEPSYWLCPPHLCDSIRPIFIYQMGSQRAGRPVCAENSSN